MHVHRHYFTDPATGYQRHRDYVPNARALDQALEEIGGYAVSVEAAEPPDHLEGETAADRAKRLGHSTAHFRA
jgi:hypothetical protein